MIEDNLTLGKQLSPPWYIYASKLKYTYGLSPLVQVNDLVSIAEHYHLVINAFDNDTAIALRQIIPAKMVFGNVTIYITIFNANGNETHILNSEYTDQTLADLYCHALKSNPLFKGIVLTEGILPGPLVKTVGNVLVVIDKSVVQFYNDDISDLCQSYTEVAAKVFKEITLLSFDNDLNAGFTSYNENCEYQKDLYNI